jgi:hypothetical protein
VTVITASRATVDARYAAVITRHLTRSEPPAAAVDDGDQDAHTTRGRPPPERAKRSTAALRSVGEHLRRVLPDAPRRPQEGSHQTELADHPHRGGDFSWPPAGTSTWPLTHGGQSKQCRRRRRRRRGTSCPPQEAASGLSREVIGAVFGRRAHLFNGSIRCFGFDEIRQRSSPLMTHIHSSRR